MTDHYITETVTMERKGTEFEAQAEFSIYGEYRAATWGYYGGDPAEYPEVEIGAVRPINAKTGKLVKAIKLTREENDHLQDVLLRKTEQRNEDARTEAAISAYESRYED